MESGKNLIDITDNRVAHENVRKYAECVRKQKRDTISYDEIPMVMSNESLRSRCVGAFPFSIFTYDPCDGPIVML